MDDLERLRLLAGTEAPVEAPEERSRKNMYEIRDLMESVEQVEETEELEEKAKPDFDDIDGDGNEEESADKAATDKEKADEGVAYTDAEMMREWSNSIYKQVDDRGHYLEQPEGETVDLSLRRYLDADAHPVKIEEDIDPTALAKAYSEFKKDKQ